MLFVGDVVVVVAVVIIIDVLLPKIVVSILLERSLNFSKHESFLLEPEVEKHMQFIRNCTECAKNRDPGSQPAKPVGLCFLTKILN